MKLLNIFTFVLCSLLINCVYAVAQKLPTIQQISVRAPGNVKPDGKISEWGQLQAFNHSTDVYYTIANNDDNLYLTIQAKDALAVKKIISGGITFGINQIDKDIEHITMNSPKLGSGIQSNIGFYLNEAQRYRDAKTGNIDSVINLANNEISFNSKEMITTGAKSLPDTISVYNEYGIKAIMLLDNKSELNYELVIPLKYLGLNIKDRIKFTYNVMLKGFTANAIKVRSSGMGGVTVTSVPRSISTGSATSADFQTLNYPTDFSGEYILK